MESQPQNPEFRNNPETFTHEYRRSCCLMQQLTSSTGFFFILYVPVNIFLSCWDESS